MFRQYHTAPLGPKLDKACKMALDNYFLFFFNSQRQFKCQFCGTVNCI